MLRAQVSYTRAHDLFFRKSKSFPAGKFSEPETDPAPLRDFLLVFFSPFMLAWYTN